MATLTRRVTVRLRGTSTELSIWADQVDTGGYTETVPRQIEAGPPTSGLWAGMFPATGAVYDPSQWTVLNFSGEQDLGPWRSDPDLQIEFQLRNQRVRVGNGAYTATWLRVNRAENNLQQNENQVPPIRWPFALQLFDEQIIRGYVALVNSTVGYFEVLLTTTPMDEITIDSPTTFNLARDGDLIDLTVLRTEGLAELDPYRLKLGERTLVVDAYATRVFRARYDRRFMVGMTVADEYGDEWTVTEVNEVVRRRGFLDLVSRRKLPDAPT